MHICNFDASWTSHFSPKSRSNATCTVLTMHKSHTWYFDDYLALYIIYSYNSCCVPARGNLKIVAMVWWDVHNTRKIESHLQDLVISPQGSEQVKLFILSIKTRLMYTLHAQYPSFITIFIFKHLQHLLARNSDPGFLKSLQKYLVSACNMVKAMC